jgi:hypothetical protein
VATDDQQYVEDLGLITTHPQLRIANRIYQEIIPRELTWIAQTRITHEQPWYLTPERRLDIKKTVDGLSAVFSRTVQTSGWRSLITRRQARSYAAASLLAAHRQRWRAHQPRIRAGAQTHRSYS